MKILKCIVFVVLLMNIFSCGKESEMIIPKTDDNIHEPIVVKGLVLNHENITVFREDTVNLIPIFVPSNVENKEVVWASSSPSIASVDADGVVIAHREGEVIITALTTDQKNFARCKVTVRDSYKVLFIGNSYTQEGIETQFLDILRRTDVGNKVQITWMHKFGLTIKGHSDAYATDKSYNRHRYVPGASAWAKDNNQVTVQEVLKATDFDLVVIQENPVSQEGWQWNNVRRAEVDVFMNKIKSDQSKLPRFGCMMGQAYADPSKVASGYNTNARNILTNNFSSKQENMYMAIADHTQAMVISMSIDVVIPWGTTLQNLRTSSLNTKHKMDLTTNGVFTDLGVGRFAAACTVFESVFTPIFGVNLDGIEYSDVTALSENTGDAKYKTAVNTESSAVALKAARSAIKAPYRISPILN